MRGEERRRVLRWRGKGTGLADRIGHEMYRYGGMRHVYKTIDTYDV